MLVWSLMLMGLSTFAIGLLPTYASIGIAAPLLLVALRFVQGFALGGEWGGAALMAVEHAPGAHRGLFGSSVALGIPAGLILANLVFFIASVSISPGDFVARGWRIPFLTSAVLVLVGLYVRVGLAESPVFANLRHQRAERDAPVRDLVRDHWQKVLLAAGSHMSSAALGYVAVVVLRVLRHA